MREKYTKNMINNGKISGLIEYLDYLKEKGLVKRRCINDLKAVIFVVLKAVDGTENWHNVGIRAIDIDVYATKFRVATLGKYAPSNYRTYKSRLKRAINWYDNFLRDSGWTPPPTMTDEDRRVKPNYDIIKNGKASGMMEYLAHLIFTTNSSRMKERRVLITVKSAALVVLKTVDGVEYWSDVDIADIDIDDYARRFKELTLNKHTSKNYRGYKNRLRRAINWYSRFLQEPWWMPTLGQNKKPNYPVCEVCDQPMSPNNGCTMRYSTINGKTYERIKNGDIDGDEQNCPECHVGIGQYHHIDCDLEVCPCCFSFLNYCECDLDSTFEFPHFLILEVLHPLNLLG